MTVIDKVRRDRRAPSRDTLKATSAFLTRMAGRRVDLGVLDDGDQRRLIELVGKARVDGGLSLGRLDESERRKYESLVERAAGMPPGAHDKAREAADLAAKANTLARRARKPRQPSVGAERNLLTQLHQHINGGFLHLDHCAVLLLVLGQLLSADPISPGSAIQGEGDDITLVIGRNGLGGRFDPDGLALPRWKQAVAHLAKNDWLVVDRNGQEYRIRVGTRTRAALAL